MICVLQAKGPKAPVKKQPARSSEEVGQDDVKKMEIDSMANPKGEICNPLLLLSLPSSGYYDRLFNRVGI